MTKKMRKWEKEGKFLEVDGDTQFYFNIEFMDTNLTITEGAFMIMDTNLTITEGAFLITNWI